MPKPENLRKRAKVQLDRINDAMERGERIYNIRMTTTDGTQISLHPPHHADKKLMEHIASILAWQASSMSR